MALINQNLSTYTTQDFAPIPPGEYDFEVSDSDVIDTKSGKRMIKLSCRVIGPTHAGRIVFENFVLGSDVAMARLKTLATVGKHPRPDYIQDTQELHGLRFRGNVGVKESEGYGPQNHFKTFKQVPAPTGQTGYVPPATQTAPAMPAATPTAPVWATPPAGFPTPVTAPPVQQTLAAPAAPKPAAPWMK